LINILDEKLSMHDTRGMSILSTMWHVPREITSRYLQKASNQTLFLIQRAAVNVTGIDGNRHKLSNKVKPKFILTFAERPNATLHCGEGQFHGYRRHDH